MKTKHHFRIIFKIGIVPVYLLIIWKIFSGKYFPIMAATSGRPILFFINVRILKKISIIAMKKTKDENLLKNIITTTIKTIKTIKSIYIFLPLLFNKFFLLLYVYCNIFFINNTVLI